MIFFKTTFVYKFFTKNTPFSSLKSVRADEELGTTPNERYKVKLSKRGGIAAN